MTRLTQLLRAAGHAAEKPVHLQGANDGIFSFAIPYAITAGATGWLSWGIFNLLTKPSQA